MEQEEDICMHCSQWYSSFSFRDKYGEGCGRCVETGDITFCSHRCVFCDHKVNEEKI